MDATNGQKLFGGQSSTRGGESAPDKSKEWQLELSMEKLRSKAATFKPLVETAKNVRMAMLDKRFAIDSVEKNQLQKCLDTLQHSIKVTSFQSMVERLESLSRQLGLKFMMSGNPGTEIFISSDMFFVEVMLEPSGLVKDVKIHHEGKSEQQSCEALASALSQGDFVDFTTQLEGLSSIYQLNADKKVKCKAFSALQSLEADLGVLAQLQTFMKEPFNLVHKSPVGILERRRGGHPMKLTYFVSPYDLIDEETETSDTLNPEIIIKRKIGYSVTVCMEGSTGNKLPTSSIISVNRSPTGKNTPSYAQLTSTNSSMLPACFVLKLGKKMPICMELVKKIQKVTELEWSDTSASSPMLSLIIQHASDGQLDCRNNRGLYVTLPDQQHCYFMTENKNMEGVLVSSIPFTHPAHVPQILICLRQQALFNCLIASCVRPMARQDPEHTTILEVSALSWQRISVSVEHPYEETMATAELDLTDISALKCRQYGVSMTQTAEQNSELGGRVLQRCLSIPLTMRSLLIIWEGNSLPAVMNNLTSSGNLTGGGNGNYNLNLGPGGKDQTGQNGTTPSMPDFTNSETKVKQEPGLNNGRQAQQQQQQQQQQSPSLHQLQQQQQLHQQSFLDSGTENSIGFPSYSGQSDTTMTTTMGTATNNVTASMLNPLQLGALLGQAKNSLTSNSGSNERSKKIRKRKTGSDGLWRSPKRKGDSGDTAEILLESSSSESSTPLGTPTGGRENLTSETRTSTPTSATSLASGMDFSNLDATDILGTDKSVSDYDLDNSERDSEIAEIQTSVEQQQQQQQSDVEELMKTRESTSLTRKSKKNRSGGEEKKSSPTNIFVDDTTTSSSNNKTLPVPPSVSITPISCGNLDQSSTTNYNSVLTGMGLERRPGIEIIPIASSPSQTNLPSSITITPIAGPAPSPKTGSLNRQLESTDESQRSERKSGGKSSSSGGGGGGGGGGGKSGGSEDNNKSGGNKLEKRRKRKREDSPMGPPEKVPSSGKQQDPLSKQMSVSIKSSTEQSPPSGGGGGSGGGLNCSSSRPTSPAAVRKFSLSPTHATSFATLVGKSSPTLKTGQSTACGNKPVQSPKHSPVYGNSPKHNTPNVPVVPMSVPMSLSVSTVSNTVGNIPSVAVSLPVPAPANASPKHGSTSSPKHGSSTSSGKPSMSALKSATNSPSGKSGGSGSSDATAIPSKVKPSSSSSSKDSSSRGDKERRTSSVGSSSGSTGHQSPKTKLSSSGKLKQLEMIPSSSVETAQVSSLQSSNNSGGNTPPSGQIDAASKSAIAAQQARNRKSSLNAVIDKLKNAQHCTESDACGNGGGNTRGNTGSSSVGGVSTSGMSNVQKEKSIGTGSGSSSSSSNKTVVEGGKSSCITKNSSVDTKNPASEYMVKHSSDGIKITINKTRTKDSKQSTANLKLSSSSSSGTLAVTTSSNSSSSVTSSSVIGGSNGSPKTHTGLKPGVNSGPASKKPQTLQTPQKLLSTKMMLAAGGMKSAISSSGSPNLGSGTNIAGVTTTGNIGGNSLKSSAKSSGSPKTSSSGATDLSRARDKSRIPKSNDKGVFASKSLSDARKSSPSALREESDSERAFKLLAAHASIPNLPSSLPPQLVMEGLKQLDTRFQIPKLSARANVADADKNKSSDKLPILSDSTKQTLDGLKPEAGKVAGLSNVSVSKSLPDDQSRRDHSQTKPDNLSIATSASGAISLNLVGENVSGLMLPPQSTADSDVPTNLCIQSIVNDESSRDSCKDLGMRQLSSSQQFLGKVDDTSGGMLSKSNISDQLTSSSKAYTPMTSSGISSTSSTGSSIVVESLNLSTKPADQAALQAKYNKIMTDEKKQTCTVPSSSSSSSTSSIFSSLSGVAAVSDGNSSIVVTSSDGGGEQETTVAAEMLLDFSAANKDSLTKSHSLPATLTQHHLTTISERAITQAAPVVRRNTPPPPPPPPPLPAPFPPVASPSVSVHIVKSPAPSPRVIPPSPHSSASPCITDDELMDEALVGLGK